MQIYLFLALGGVILYLWGYFRGKKAGDKQLFDSLCQPYRNQNKTVKGVDGCVYQVKTQFLHCEVVVDTLPQSL